ncbi:MAG: ABC transporter permease [Acidobacteriota bacterium]
MKDLLQDLRYSFRLLFKNFGFTAVALITLALGIGANSAIFSVVNTVLLTPLAYKDSERLVMMNHRYPKLDLNASVSAVGFTHYRDQNQSFENILAFNMWQVNLTGAGEPERLSGLTVTPTFFPTLGIDPAKGRVFLAEEDQPGRNKVVVLSDGLWRRRFGADPNILNQSITLNGESYNVIGIMPPSFQFGREFAQTVDLYAPLTFTEAQLQPNRWRNEFLTVLARLKPGVTFEQAQTEMDSIAANVRQQYFTGSDASDPGSWGLRLRPLHELIVGDIRPALLVLLAAVGLVLLIACANVANLLLARAASRQKEVAIRVALGASRMRMIRQFLTESVVLALIGGTLGTLLAIWGINALLKLNNDLIPRSQEIGLDSRVLIFTLGISLLTGILFGLVPALQSSKTDLHDTLKEGGRSGASGTKRNVRSALVVAEIALALVLLIGAGLLIRSFTKLQDVSPGFNPENLLVMQVALPGNQYNEPQKIDNFFQQALQSIQALPGVQSAGVASTVPMSGNNSSGSFAIEGRTVQPGEMAPWGNRWQAGSNYFQTLNIPLIKGRFFDDRDVLTSQPVAIIDETMQRKFWPDEDPVGKRISFQRDPQGNPIWREIVGIVGHVRHRGLEGESPVQYYLPHRQLAGNGMFVIVRTANEPSGLASAVRGAIQSVDRDLPVYRVTTMEQVVTDSMTQRRFAMTLLGIFALVALILASVGLYGVMAYSVTQRTHEIGIRMALGAKSGDVLKMVVGQGMVLAVIGLGIGLVAAFGLTRLMTTLLFGVSATDPLIFAILPLLLAGVAVAASLIPARRATKVEPIIALRYE